MQRQCAPGFWGTATELGGRMNRTGRSQNEAYDNLWILMVSSKFKQCYRIWQVPDNTEMSQLQAPDSLLANPAQAQVGPMLQGLEKTYEHPTKLSEY